ncbi:MAG: nucleotidyltransferase domain-containing protein [Oscillospiraceae bacterium]|nr:nucleotidyltransferase domain-containing protein [Oscillospiraceae bacterium]
MDNIENISNNKLNKFSTTLRQVTNAILELDLPLSKIILFGSVARGDYSIRSDIDIAIITTMSISNQQKKMVARAVADFETLESLLEINCFYATDASLSNANHWSDPCVDIRKEGVVLWQKDRF